MSVLVNLNVYVLLFGPVALLLRGYGITLTQYAWLALLLIAVQLLELLLLESLPTALWLRSVARVALLPCVEATLFEFVLTDSKAQKALSLQTQPHDDDDDDDDDNNNAHNDEGSNNNNKSTGKDDVSRRLRHDTPVAAVTTLWCLSDTLLTRWFVWYGSMSRPGFALANVCRAADAFALLLVTLAACRVVRRGATRASSASSLLSPRVVVVVVVRMLTALFSHAVVLLLPLPPLLAALCSRDGYHKSSSTSNGMLANALAAAALTVTLRHSMHTRHRSAAQQARKRA